VTGDLGLDGGFRSGLVAAARGTHREGVEGDGLALVGGDAVDDDALALCDLELLTAHAHHGVGDVGVVHPDSREDNGGRW